MSMFTDETLLPEWAIRTFVLLWVAIIAAPVIAWWVMR